MLCKLLTVIDSFGGTWSMRTNSGLITECQNIIVSVEDFFDEIPSNGYYFASNTDLGDKEFYTIFKTIKNKNNVQNVWIVIYDYDPTEDEYPYAEVCYITTTSDKDEVLGWFGDKAFPDRISSCENIVDNRITLTESGFHIFSCWWD